MSKKDDVFEQIIERAKKDGSYYATYSTKKHMSKKDEALKQSLITEAAIQSKDHPSKDARTFAKSVHEYLMAEQPAQHRAWFTVDELNAWADKKLEENPQWAEKPAQQALDKMAENAKELGLDYEPSSGTQVSKVWRDGEKLVAKQVPLDDFYKPAQRKPLTDEEWQSIADTLGCFITRGQKDAIEAALGIKENT